MDENLDEEIGFVDEDDNDLFVVYVLPIGQNSDGMNIYHIFLSSTPEDTFSEGWSEKPACVANRELMVPDSSQYERVAELKTTVKLDVAQDNCCFSMQDCRDRCIALASENLDEADEYPEPCRIVIQFAEAEDELESMLARRDMLLKYV